jgi:hypothetical protein
MLLPVTNTGKDRPYDSWAKYRSALDLIHAGFDGNRCGSVPPNAAQTMRSLVSCRRTASLVAAVSRPALNNRLVKYAKPMDVRQIIAAPILPAVDHLSGALHSVAFAMLGESTEALRADRRFLMAYTHLNHVTDKAVREYIAAQEVVRKFESIKFGDTIAMDKIGVLGQQRRLVTDHLETCLDATHRGVCAADLLRKSGFGKDAPRPDRGAVKRLKKIRDTSQHTINRLLDEKLKPEWLPFGPEDPYGIRLLEHELKIGADEPLTYVELVGVMENCYRTAQAIGGRTVSGTPGGI